MFIFKIQYSMVSQKRLYNGLPVYRKSEFKLQVTIPAVTALALRRFVSFLLLHQTSSCPPSYTTSLSISPFLITMARTDRQDTMDPSARDVQMDIVEWRSNAVLQDTCSPELLQQRADAFETALEALGGEIPGHGRFFNRVYLTASLCGLFSAAHLSRGWRRGR